MLIVLTDGNDTGSVVPPVDAAKVAATHGIRIYTIAIGDPTTVGEEALDLDTIERVSELTDGKAFRALDQEQLQLAYETIGELEPELYETLSFRPRQSLHFVPIALALLFLPDLSQSANPGELAGEEEYPCCLILRVSSTSTFCGPPGAWLSCRTRLSGGS